MRWCTLLGLLVVGCDGEMMAAPNDAGADAGTPPAPVDAGPREPLDYADERFWLCRPGIEDDECLDADLSATEVLPDGSLVPADRFPPAPDPDFDCFYVYPTVALSGRFGNVDVSVLDDHGPMLDPLLSQGAWFREQCRVFAPLYRQITFTTYAREDAQVYLENAYLDVAAAFDAFLADSGDRPFVILGHSQGAQMLRRLLQRVVDPDPALRARLVAGLLIGGDLLDSHFDNIPTCASEDEVGCVMGYWTFGEGFAPGREMQAEQTCANPAAPGGGEGRLSGAFFPRETNQSAFDVNADWDPSITTAFVLYRDLYTAECVPSGEGEYLEVRVRPEPGDTRDNPVPFDHSLFSPDLLGLHVLDFNFVLEDLLRLVAHKAAMHAGG